MRYATTKQPRVYLGIRIPPPLKKRLEDMAKSDRVSLTDAVESLLVWALAKAEKARAAK